MTGGNGSTCADRALKEMSFACELNERIAAYNQHIQTIARDDELARQITTLSAAMPTTGGGAYLRTILILWAQVVLAAGTNKTDAVSRWVRPLAAR